MADFKEALQWYLSSSQPVLCVEREAIIRELRAVPSCDGSFVYCRDWANFVFQRFYANRNAHAKAQQVSSNLPLSSPIPASAEFVCPELEKYINKDLFCDGTPSLRTVKDALGSLKKSYDVWLDERKDILKQEVGCKLTEPIEWPSISLKSDSLLSDQRMERQLLRTIALSKKGYTISRNDVQHLMSLFEDDIPPAAPHKHHSKTKSSDAASSSGNQMLFADLDKTKDVLNAVLDTSNVFYADIACDKILSNWKSIYDIIDFIERMMGELESIIGEDSIDKELETLCITHGMDVFVPFDVYWHPIQEILKRKYKSSPEKLDSEIGSALAKYFRFYRDVTDASNGIPGVIKNTVTKVMDFTRDFMNQYSDLLKSITLSNRPEITEKILRESMLSFEGLTKVTESRIKELALDMDEKKAEILDEIVDFIDFLSDDENPYGRLERLSKRETKKRFGKLDRQFVNLVKSIKSFLTASFPSLQLALIGYMLVKFFVCEKTFDETKMIGDLMKVKLGNMVQKVKQREELLAQYSCGFNAGASEVAKAFTRAFKKDVVQKYEDHLALIARDKLLAELGEEEERQKKEKQKEAAAAAALLVSQVKAPVPVISEEPTKKSKKKKNKTGPTSSNETQPIDSPASVVLDANETVPSLTTSPSVQIIDGDAKTSPARLEQTTPMDYPAIIARLQQDNSILRAHMTDMEAQMVGLRETNERLLSKCQAYAAKLQDMETDAARATPPISRVVSPIGAHLKGSPPRFAPRPIGPSTTQLWRTKSLFDDFMFE